MINSIPLTPKLSTNDQFNKIICFDCFWARHHTKHVEWWYKNKYVLSSSQPFENRVKYILDKRPMDLMYRSPFLPSKFRTFCKNPFVLLKNYEIPGFLANGLFLHILKSAGFEALARSHDGLFSILSCIAILNKKMYQHCGPASLFFPLSPFLLPILVIVSATLEFLLLLQYAWYAQVLGTLCCCFFFWLK